MLPRGILLCLLAGSCLCLTDLENKVVDAIQRAQIVVLARNSKAPTISEDGTNMQSQKASAGSQLEQVRGDLLMETTKILVEENGASILPSLEDLDIDALIATANGASKKKKRYASQPPMTTSKCTPDSTDCTIQKYNDLRSVTGVCNNKQSKSLGMAVTAIRRLKNNASYADGIGAVRTKSVTGSPLPSTRDISNKIMAEGAQIAFDYMTNHLHMQMGQYIAHDIIFMPSSVGPNGETLDCSHCNSTNVTVNCAPIAVPVGDSYFPANTCIRLSRSLNAQKGLGQRTQINQNTHFLDLSVVYGSEECEAATVRSFVNGELSTFNNNGYPLPPQNKNDTNCQSKSPNFCFSAGDFRNSLHPGLVPIHTVFIKEHNRIAQAFKALRPTWSDEQTYQESRRVMIAQYQHMVYSEYLPKLLSDKVMTEFGLKPLQSGYYTGYCPQIAPTLTAEFSASAFRFGHSQARKDIPRLTNTNMTRAAAVDLGASIFYADSQYQATAGGTESMLEGMVQMPAMKVDNQFSFPIRNQLFETRGKPASGVDLVAVNMMRGRDVGLFPYNEYRTTVGLKRAVSFADLSSEMDSVNIAALQKVYADVNDIDLYPGLLMERPIDGSMLGRTGQYIIAETFSALKRGDRFYYENQVAGSRSLTADELSAIRRTKFARFICSASSIMTNVNQQPFDLCIRLSRSLNAQKGLGQRTQINQNTHFLDLSVVYGSEECEAATVRSFVNGALSTFNNNGYPLPPQSKNDTNCQSKAPNFCFSAGDFRNSLHPGLVPIHTVFIKEHNRIAQAFKALRPTWSDEQTYQESRRVMIAQYQHMVYSEYLPKLLSDKVMTEFGLKPLQSGYYTGYCPQIAPTLTAEFSASAFRFGHSQARKDIPRLTNTNMTRAAAVDLGANIFYADSQYQATAGGTESMLEGMVQMPAMKVDNQFSFPIRNQLFETRGKPASGVDLVAVNMMRGRDVGLFPYNEYRATVGLKRATSFADLSSEMDAVNIAALQKVYADVNDIDLYPGLLMERPIDGSMLGRTGQYIIAETFSALKRGDRFYYENQVAGSRSLTTDELSAIRRTKFARFICSASSIMTNVNQQPFDLASTRVPCTSIPDIDIHFFVPPQ